MVLHVGTLIKLLPLGNKYWPTLLKITVIKECWGSFIFSFALLSLRLLLQLWDKAVLTPRQTPGARSVLAFYRLSELLIAMYRWPKQLTHGHFNCLMAATILAPLVVMQDIFLSSIFQSCTLSRHSRYQNRFSAGARPICGGAKKTIDIHDVRVTL